MLQRILSTLRNRQASTTAKPPPTHPDLCYSDAFARCTLDLWLPEADTPAPLMLMFHGGAFMRGNKVRDMPYRRDLLALVQDGVAVASVGYPLLGDLGAKRTDGPEPYLKIMREAANAVRFLQERTAKYNLDPARFISGGSSAGAIIAEWATYAEPLSISFCIALEQPYGVHQVLPYIKKGGAPILLHTRASRLDLIHHPRNARAVQARCDEVGVRCWLYGTGHNGLPAVPDGLTVIQQAMEVIRE
ncbi:alpha/beta hydrolase [Cerasicoccus fimbriatus]|uniref:alpha/beta hydrolase n=1 Tax=Cerasicoccus fimbriatus TaxID=3014554 RepID=UPI0022B3D411|nr:alpha/beta hydrolase [Cerasicoccus sp. TK19100]